MSSQMNPLAHAHFKKFKEYVGSRGAKVFAAVVEADGTIRTTGTAGERAFFAKYLAQAEVEDRRKSGAWIPTAPLPKLPLPLADMMNYTHFAEVKRTATAFLHHFLLPGQKIGEVCIHSFQP